MVRLAQRAELAALPGIERSAGAAFRSVAGLEWISDDAVMSVEAHVAVMARGRVWATHDVGGALAGFLSAELWGDTLHLWQMAVRHDVQRGGHGRALLKAAVRHARTRRCRAVTLTTSRDVAWNAPFYARQGFAVLSEAELDPRLRTILEHEVAQGLPPDRRCAMRLDLSAGLRPQRPGATSPA